MISTKEGGLLSSRQAVVEPPASRVVPKPVSEAQAKDPRRYQLDQLKKRFAAAEKTVNGGTTLAFKLSPTDPDFPFDLDHLEVELRVPSSYPSERPTIAVKNRDIPRGFSINIERGWDRFALENDKSTLLALTNLLDRRLEGFLAEQKVDTVKLVTFKDTRHLTDEGIPIGRQPPSSGVDPSDSASAPNPVVARLPKRESYTKEQIAEARERRAQETKQIESRMGRLANYQKSSDGIIYVLPLEPKRRSELPPGLISVRTIQLVVPLLYPLQPTFIFLNDITPEDALGVEDAFGEHVEQHKDMSLMSHVNFLSQNLHVFAKAAAARQIEKHAATATTAADSKGKEPLAKETVDDGKSHIQVIPRPPEWTMVHDPANPDDSDDDSDYDSDDSGGGAAIEPTESVRNAADTTNAEHGTAIYLPLVELHGIELLQISVLNITVKCERCKTPNEVTSLKPGVQKSGSCSKCASPFIVSFRQQLVHQNSTRAGLVDVAGCTVFSLLPSSFIPTCSNCSTAASELTAVQGDAITNACRECHARFTFKIPEVKFVRVTPATVLPATAGPRRKKEDLGIRAGEQLPERGVCAHYRRSYRWFRFSCCSKVYPCDRCHDAAEQHVNEWANRMICGWCSREQNYSVDACKFCGRSVIGRKGRGFWEGGRGTRDKKLMSKRDPRKYKRVGGTDNKKHD